MTGPCWKQKQRNKDVIHAFQLLGQIASWKRVEGRSPHCSSSTKCMSYVSHSLGSHLHQKITHVSGCAGLTYLTMGPLRAYTPPPSHGHLLQPSQSPAWSRYTVSITGSPGPASIMENQPACSPQGPFFVPIKGLASCSAATETFWKVERDC